VEVTTTDGTKKTTLKRATSTLPSVSEESASGEATKQVKAPEPAAAQSETKPQSQAEPSSGVADDVAPASAAALLSMLAPTGGAKEGPLAASSYTPPNADKLNLSGILNALDGVVDSPNRILIMTSNHPEKLDPALIRPGRIDKRFLLSYMAGLQATHMVAHYFQMTLDAADSERLAALVDGGNGRRPLDITPARLEQLCAENDTVDGLCVALKDLGGPVPGEAPGSTLVGADRFRACVETVLNRAQSVPARTADSARRW
jgi:SpoVK/Ycf46/Vps4 family AAA+-type ATPase